ncbi:hypothetical protein Tco_0451989 [Tanacetum coccineum]
MDLETAQTTTTAKLSILKPSEYDMWRLRIEQYFQVQDYALWDVIKNGNSFKPVAQTTTNADGTSTSLIPSPVTTEEKAQDKNDVKARNFRRFTNEVNTAYGVSTANTQVSLVSTASTQVSTANLSDATIYAFLANQPNRSQLVHEDLEQIHEDDLEEINLKWQLALLSMRTRRFFQKTGRKITINGSDTAVYDNSRRTVKVEETSSKAMVAIDGAGFDWSYMADDEVPTNMTFMAFFDSEFNKSEFNLATYKRGLASVEEQLVFYKKNEVIFCEQLAVLKRDISYKDSEISMLKNKLIESQIPDKSRKGVEFVSYNTVPPPPTWLFSPSKFDLSNSGLEEFQQPEFEGYEPKLSKSFSEDTSNEVRESPDAPLVEELVSDDKLEKKTVFPTVAKIEFVRPKQQEKPVRKPVKYAKMYRLTAITIKGKGWNMVPRAVLMKTGLKSLNTARPVNTAHPKTTVCSARPMPHFLNQYNQLPKAVNTARPNSAVVNAVRANQVNAVKASACWVWRPTKLNSASITLKRHNYVNARGISKSVMAWSSRNLMDDMLPLGEEPKKGKLLVKELLKLLLQVQTLMNLVDGSLFDSSSKNASNDEPQPSSDAGKKDDEGVNKESGIDDQERPENITTALLETTHADFFGDETKVDMRNITTTYPVPSTLNTRIHKDHSLDHVISDVQSGVQTRRMTKTTNEQGFISAVYEGKTHEDLHTCLFACFLSQEEPKKVYRNKKDERVIMIRNKSRLVAQGYTQEKGIDYDEMDVKSAFLYGKIEEDINVYNPPASTPIETSKPLLKDAEAEDVDVHLYRSMIGSLMYLTSSRPDIMFADSIFDLEAYPDSDYAGASLDRKSTTGGCQFLGIRLISTHSDPDLYLQYKMSGEEPAPQMAPVESPQMISTVKLPMLKKVIMNGDEPVQTTKDENGVETEVPPKTAQALLQRQKERKAKSIMLLAIPDEYQLRFHTIKDAKSLWAAIKSRFGGNVESKKMQKNVLKQQFENFSVSDTEGLDKAYDSGPQLDDEDLEQIDHDNLEEMDIKWQVAMLSMRVKRFYKKTGRKECRAPRNQGNRNGDAGYRSRDNTQRTVLVETSDALVVQDNALIVQDGLGYNWSYIAQDEHLRFALMAYNSNSSGSDIRVRPNFKEREDLKAKLEQFETSFKNLNKLINSQISSKDKTGLGYGDQLNENDSSGSELFNSVFDSRSSDGDDNQTNDRFKKDNEYHVVPPPLTRNYMPPLADLSFAGLDDSVYRPITNKTSASVSQVETSNTPPSNTSVEMPRVESVRPSGVIVKDWVSDDEEDIF